MRTLGLAATAAALGLSTSAQAQIAGSVSVVSDYRLRAASMSDKRPAATLTVSDDFANGVYLGATVVGSNTGDGNPLIGHIEYLGFAHRAASGLTWEVGADNVDFKLYPEPNFHLSYSEAYAGVSNGTFSSRLYISPNYLQEGLTTAYFEVNGVTEPAEDWRLSGHLGVFKPLSGTHGTTVRKDRLDLRVGGDPQDRADGAERGVDQRVPGRLPHALAQRRGRRGQPDGVFLRRRSNGGAVEQVRKKPRLFADPGLLDVGP